MLEAYGWAVVRSSRDAYRHATEAELDAVDAIVDRADHAVFERLESFLAQHEPPDLDWHFRPQMNNARGILTLSSSRNHRGDEPTVLRVLAWLSEHAPGSYGLVYLHDDEDVGEWAIARGRPGRDYTDVFRVWRLLHGRVEELEDPFLSPIVARLAP